MAALFLDNDVSVRLAVLLNSEGHDVTTARQERRRSASDAEQLLRASEQGRILVTHNTNDYVLLHDAWLLWSSAWGIEPHHAGILTIPQSHHVPVDRMARDIDRLLQSGTTVVDRLYRRRIGGARVGWERWRIGVGWTSR